MVVQRPTIGVEASGNLRSSQADNAFSKAAFDLAAFGLTPNQARIYLTLTIMGGSTARPIYESLGIHKVDAYRNLHELEKAGLVEIQLGSPVVYSALEPTAALSVLLKKKENEIALSRNHLAEIASEICAVKRDDQSYTVGAHGQLKQMFKLGLGSEGSTFEWKNLAQNAEKEIQRIAGGALRIDYARILAGVYSKAKERGVSVRIITQVNASNRALLKKLSKTVPVRQMEGIQLRLGIVDQKTVLLHAGFTFEASTMAPEKNSYLIVENEMFAAGFAAYFERLWELSTPLNI